MNIVFIDGKVSLSFFKKAELNSMLIELFDLSRHKKAGKHLIHYNGINIWQVPQQFEIDKTFSYIALIDSDIDRFEYLGLFMYAEEDGTKTEAMNYVKEILNNQI